jgi:hypothetical protein
MTSARKEFRQHSKSTLLRASSRLFAERDAIIDVEARKWKRRCAVAITIALLLGGAIGYGTARLIGTEIAQESSSGSLQTRKENRMVDDKRNEPDPVRNPPRDRDRDNDGKIGEGDRDTGKQPIGPGGSPMEPQPPTKK